ncbi:MAG TPA: gliding motility-associated C-terminal domain-containing protein [Bacteroidia bacterium]|jgi:gliding motility-associated-like protein|nr:gliding motility-associated C-terminal domain-containing protein [Bacteroidia bacterium]
MKTRSIVHAPKSFVILSLCILLLSSRYTTAQLVVNPGQPQTICKGDSATLGGTPTASGGTAPYSYVWLPSAGMNNSNDANPSVIINNTTTFTVTVNDAAGNRKVDSVVISLSNVDAANAGHDTEICPLTSGATLGGSANSSSFNYVWTPAGSGLSCYTCPHPTATPTVTTTYSLIASSGGCGDTTSVLVTVLASPTITVTSPVSVKEGSEVTLNASGGVKYMWMPDTSSIIFNPNTSDPQVFPNVTTTFTVIGIGADNCPGVNVVVVDVIPDKELTFYNTFTPNGDGINDTWFIGNIDLYPNNSLTIFNRYGIQVYYSQPYFNQWDGTIQGSNLPDATYYYILDTGEGDKYKGAVTIIRKPK